jgi:hypothetical protein
MPLPVIFRLRDNKHARRGNMAGGTGPFIPDLPPTLGHSLVISGVTKDSAGAVLGSCAVDLFTTADDVIQGRTVSDASTGAYSFSAGGGRTYYIVAYKAGSPDVAGTTVNTLVVTG